MSKVTKLFDLIYEKIKSASDNYNNTELTQENINNIMNDPKVISFLYTLSQEETTEFLKVIDNLNDVKLKN